MYGEMQGFNRPFRQCYDVNEQENTNRKIHPGRQAVFHWCVLFKENLFSDKPYNLTKVHQRHVKFVIAICLPTKHLGLPMNLLKRPCVPDRIGIWKCWFLGERKTGVPGEKPLGAQGENQQQTKPTCCFDAGI